MATATLPNSSLSVNTQLEALRQRVLLLEADNARLRQLLAKEQSRFSEAAPGQYLVCDDGDLQGPLTNAARAALDCTAEGVGCTVVSVLRRQEPAPSIAGFGVAAGLDFPGTLVRAA